MTLEQYLDELDLGLQQRGHAPLDEASLREVAKHLNHPEVMQKLQSGELTTQKLLDEIDQGVQGARQKRSPTNVPVPVPDFAKEGGLINDSSGRGTALLKQRGYQVEP